MQQTGSMCIFSKRTSIVGFHGGTLRTTCRLDIHDGLEHHTKFRAYDIRQGSGALVAKEFACPVVKVPQVSCSDRVSI